MLYTVLKGWKDIRISWIYKIKSLISLCVCQENQLRNDQGNLFDLELLMERKLKVTLNILLPKHSIVNYFFYNNWP